MAESIRVCALTDLEINAPVRAVLNDTIPVAVVRTSDTEVYAIGDICSHGDVSLSEGFAQDCKLECWAHGSEFDLKTGKALTLPAFEPVPVYAVTITGGDVFIDPDGKISQ